MLGNIGSGKTLTLVREMYRNQGKRNYYTNLKTDFTNTSLITADMIVQKKQTDIKISKATGEAKVKYEYSLNKDFWQEQPKPLVVAIDEAHQLFNSRQSMSKKNIVGQDFVSLIRRIANHKDGREGELILVTQFLHRLDISCREMATQFRYHICHYYSHCSNCSLKWKEDSELPKDLKKEFCPMCGKATKKIDHVIEVFHFSTIEDYYNWYFNRHNTFYAHYLINNIDFFFDKYDSLQWENMFSVQE